MLEVSELLQQFDVHYWIRVKRVSSIVEQRQQQTGELRLNTSGRRFRMDPAPRQGFTLCRPVPHAQGLAPQLPAGACQRPFDCSEWLVTRWLGPDWATKTPKRLNIIQNGTNKPPGRAGTGSDTLLYARGYWGHRRRPFGACVTPGASVFYPFVVRWPGLG